MKNNPICFFDSGIGGSTILREVYKILPDEKYIYYADTKNNPYGNKTKEELFVIVDNIIQKLLKYNPKLIVCACNTATAMVLDDIRKKYPYITFIGTEPAVKVIYDNYKDKKSIVLTTKGTGESAKFKELFNTYKTDNCTLVEVPELANLIETNKASYSYLKKLLKNFDNIDIVVLGCTHFPLVKKEISQILKNVEFIDGSVGIANRIKYLLEKNNIQNDKKNTPIKILAESLEIENRILSIVK